MNKMHVARRLPMNSNEVSSQSHIVKGLDWGSLMVEGRGEMERWMAWRVGF